MMMHKTAAYLAMFIAMCALSGLLYAQDAILALDNVTLEGVWYSDGAWGDYDNDSDLDLIIGGYWLGGAATSSGVLKLYNNAGNSVFNDAPTNVIGVGNGSIKWCDLDNDNDLDLVICGQVLSNVDSLKIYRNDNGTFVDSGFQFESRTSSSVSFGDYDNDGDYDILLSGENTNMIAYTNILKNNGNFEFSDIVNNMQGVANGWASWGDFDNDGDLDIGLTGRHDNNDYITRIYRNDGNNAFVSVSDTLFLGLRYSKCHWMDYDVDGDLDFFVTGSYLNEAASEFRLYKNNGVNGFAEILMPGVSGMRHGDMTWGDINNDGYADLLLNGMITNNTTVGNVFFYNPGTGNFDTGEEIVYLKYAKMLLGDYNNDRRLDLSLSGRYDYQDYDNQLYMNTSSVANSAPYAPTGLNSNPDAGFTLLAWDYALDNETPDLGLTYNLRIGTTPGGNEVLSSMSAANGYRKISAPGNCENRPFYKIYGLPDGRYYWSVQAIDNSFVGSPFAGEQHFDIGVGNTDELQPTQILSIITSPNPFRGSTQVSVSVKKAADMTISVYNIKGELVKNLHQGNLDKGIHHLNWNGTNAAGQSVVAGIYMVKAVSDGAVSMTKTMYIK